MYRSFTNTLVLTYLQLIIEAQRGNGYKGDIAIDDISITDSNCPSKKHALFLVDHNKFYPMTFIFCQKIKKNSSMQKICYCAIIYLYLHTLSITQKYNT